VFAEQSFVIAFSFQNDSFSSGFAQRYTHKNRLRIYPISNFILNGVAKSAIYLVAGFCGTFDILYIRCFEKLKFSPEVKEEGN